MYFWAPSGRSKTEVDFLLVRGADLTAVEAKSGNTFNDAWCKGLRAVAKLNGLWRQIIVYPRGPALKTADRIEVYPFQDFSDLLATDGIF